MPRRPVDLGKVRKARAELERLAEAHPEAFEPDRLPTTAARLQKALAFDPDAPEPYAIRLRPSTREALAKRAKEVGKKPGTLARELIEMGLK